MPTAVGPNTKGEENLVFGYDLGDVSNSYKGAPTVNYISHQNAVAQSSYTSYSATSNGNWNNNHPNAIRAYNVDGGEITGYVNTGVGDWENTYHAVWEYDAELGRPVVVMDCTDSNWKAKSFNPNTGQWASQGWTVGTKYVVSWLQWTTHLDKSPHVGLYTKNSSNSNNFWDGLSNNSTTSRNTKVRTWQRVYHVFTVTSNWDQTIDYQRIYMYGHYFRNGAGVKFKIADVQLEINQDYASPFTGNSAGTSGRTTRSATQGLLDLTGNSTIDLTNVSFDSNAQMTFDGTTDYISMNAQNLVGATAGTVSAWVNLAQANVNHAGIFCCQVGPAWADMRVVLNVSTPNRIRLAISDGTNSTQDSCRTNSTLSYNTWYHIVATYDGTSAKIYVNGVLDETHNTTITPGTFTPGATMIGYQNYSNRYFNGDIAAVATYNRALSAEEIKSNFNAIKGRFNI
jgi:hypothetical protein